MLKKLFLTVILLSSSLSLAGKADDNSCGPYYYLSFAGIDFRPLTGCKLIEPLTLTSKWMVVPKLGPDAINVRYWTGQMSRKYIREDHYGECSGGNYHDTVFPKGKRELTFDIINPNLSPKVSSVEQLAPMTEAEAIRAFAELKERCLNSEPSD